jgi:nicotinamide riboside transporter PnuC
MITYLGMTMPMAVVSLISWLRHPYKKTAEVAVSKLTRGKLIFTAVSSVAVTVGFYFILKAFGTANLLPSTVSVLTSFAAATLTAFRCPYFAVLYAANDLVLIILWILASIEDISYLPMTVCFFMFFINDFYGFICWRRMEKRQAE